MAMSKKDSSENLEPQYRSTFSPIVDDAGFLVNQDDLICQEVTEKSLVILRTSKDLKNNAKAAKDVFNMELPEPLQMTIGDKDLKCFWVSPDEFWVVLSAHQKQQLEGKFDNLPAGVSITDNSAAYGTLEFSGKKMNDLLSRWMSYDLEGNLNDAKAASTTFGQAPVFVYRDKKNLFMMVRHSFSHYVAGLIQDSAKRI